MWCSSMNPHMALSWHSITPHSTSWQSMTLPWLFHGIVWSTMSLPWYSIQPHRASGALLKISGNFMNPHRSISWRHMKSHGVSWNRMAFNWHSAKPHTSTERHSMKPQGTFMAPHWTSIVLHKTSWGNTSMAFHKMSWNLHEPHIIYIIDFRVMPWNRIAPPGTFMAVRATS